MKIPKSVKKTWPPTILTRNNRGLKLSQDTMFYAIFVIIVVMKNILILLTIPLVLVGYYLGLTYFLSDFELRGQFGDMFGAVNALFSGFAFLGIIYTIHLQRNELSLQREELKLTRRELTRTAEAQEKSEKALSKQAASLKVTAKLNGLSAILQHHNSLIEVSNSARYGIDVDLFGTNKKSAEKIIEEINKLTENK